MTTHLDHSTRMYEHGEKEYLTMNAYLAKFKDFTSYKEGQANVEQQRRIALMKNKIAIDTLDVKVKAKQKERRRYHNEIQDLKGQIRVYCRVRPVLNKDNDEDAEHAICIPAETRITHLSTTLPERTSQKQKEYVFHKVFPPEAQHDEVFESVKDLVQSAVDGYNVCVLAYGHIGTGKTHTILGSNESPGVARYAVQELFRVRDKQRGILSFKIDCSIVELYLDELHDLLSSENETSTGVDVRMRSRQSKTTGTRHSITSEQEFLRFLGTAVRKRHTRRITSNALSSRSHMIISIYMKTTDKKSQEYCIGKLSFVDLAGMEKKETSHSSKLHVKEALANNASFQCLHEVIHQRAEGVTDPPWSANKLTRLLKEYLEDESKTVTFVNVSPCSKDLRETQSALSSAKDTAVFKKDGITLSMHEEENRLKEQIRKWEEEEESDLLRVLEQF